MPRSDPGLRIDVDSGRCQGLGICESIAPEHFEVRDDGAMRIIQAGVTVGLLDRVREAVELCPTQALRLTGEPQADGASRRRQ
jgi:ferredoxin